MHQLTPTQRPFFGSFQLYRRPGVSQVFFCRDAPFPPRGEPQSLSAVWNRELQLAAVQTPSESQSRHAFDKFVELGRSRKIWAVSRWCGSKGLHPACHKRQSAFTLRPSVFMTSMNKASPCLEATLKPMAFPRHMASAKACRDSARGDPEVSLFPTSSWLGSHKKFTGLDPSGNSFGRLESSGCFSRKSYLKQEKHNF